MPASAAVALATILVALVAPLHAPQPAADPADGTIADIVRVSYEVISGPPGTPRQWRRDSTLYAPGAMFHALGQDTQGRVSVTSMTPEEFGRRTDKGSVTNGRIECEIGSQVERFGHVAQVRSVYTMRRTAQGSVVGRGVNCFQLYWDGTRWWIAGIVWDDERDNNPIPKGWAGAR
jgi:hypothetical protein